MRYPLTIAFMVYHEGDPELDRVGGVIDRVGKWITANSLFDVIPIIKPAAWDGQISKYGTLYFLDPGDVDQKEIPDANFKVLLWSCKKFTLPGEPVVCPSAGGHPYGPDAETQRRTGTTSAYVSVPYCVWWNAFLPEGMEWPYTPEHIREAIARTGWQTGLESTIITELKTAIVATLRDKYGIWIKNTYRPPPTERLQEWFNEDDYPNEPELYKAFFAQLTDEHYQKLADYVSEPLPEPPVEAELRQRLVAVEADLTKVLQDVKKIMRKVKYGDFN